jgi:hypothetical protein
MELVVCWESKAVSLYLAVEWAQSPLLVKQAQFRLLAFFRKVSSQESHRRIAQAFTLYQLTQMAVVVERKALFLAT